MFKIVPQYVPPPAKAFYRYVGLPTTNAAVQTFNMKLSPYKFALGVEAYGAEAREGIGFTQNITIFRYNKKDILFFMKKDLNELGYKCKKRLPVPERRYLDELKEDEVYLQVWYKRPDRQNPRGDYRIIRYEKSAGMWFFKPDFDLPPAFCIDIPNIHMIMKDSSYNYTPISMPDYYLEAYIVAKAMNRFEKGMYRAIKFFNRIYEKFRIFFDTEKENTQ